MTYINSGSATEYELGHTYIQLNGNDVTRDCFEADDEAGYVGLFQRNKMGHKFLDFNGEVAIERLGGKVVILVMPETRTVPCALEVSTRTVALFPPNQKERMACYKCGYWVALKTTASMNQRPKFVHTKKVIDE